MSSVVVSFMALFIFAFFILSICVYRTTKKKQTITPRVRLLLMITMASVVIQIALLFAKKCTYGFSITLYIFGEYMWDKVCGS